MGMTAITVGPEVRRSPLADTGWPVLICLLGTFAILTQIRP